MNKTGADVLARVGCEMGFSPSGTLLGIAEREYLMLAVTGRFCMTHESGKWTRMLEDSGVHLPDLISGSADNLVSISSMRQAVYPRNGMAFEFSKLMTSSLDNCREFLERYYEDFECELSDILDKLSFEDLKLIYEEFSTFRG